MLVLAHAEMRLGFARVASAVREVPWPIGGGSLIFHRVSRPTFAALHGALHQDGATRRRRRQTSCSFRRRASSGPSVVIQPTRRRAITPRSRRARTVRRLGGPSSY